MDVRTTATTINVDDIQKSLDFYTGILGFQIIERRMLRNGKIIRASVGFDSPLLMLSPNEYSRPSNGPETLQRGAGVKVRIRIRNSQRLELCAGAVARGIATVRDPFADGWSDHLFTVVDPDGYAVSFDEMPSPAVHSRHGAFDTGVPRMRPRRTHDSIFSTR